MPPACLACGAEIDNENNVLCDDCLNRLEVNTAFCKVCGHPWVDGGTCEDCRRSRPVYTRLRTPFVYGGTSREMVLGLKYSGRTELLPFLAQSMVWAMARERMLKADLVIPVPTTIRKFRQRGYNPPGLLAHWIAGLLDVPEEHNLLAARAGKGQKGKGRQQRIQSRQGAFFVRTGWVIEKENILLVDDVVTTGATANACAKALKTAGAGRVYVVAVARSDNGQ